MLKGCKKKMSDKLNETTPHNNRKEKKNHIESAVFSSYMNSTEYGYKSE